MQRIQLSQAKWALIDESDAPLISERSWFAVRSRGCFYAAAKNYTRGVGEGPRFLMHRIIMGVDDPTVFVDHIDGDGLNNQRSNLRLASRAENKRNGRDYRNNTSGVKGVWFQDGRWWGGVKLMGVNHRKGFPTFAEAVEWRRATAQRLHGEFYRP